MRTVDEDGPDVAVGDPGEILNRGPGPLRRLHRSGADPAAFDDEGWFPTGDVGVLDEDGYLTIVDRIKDIIIRGGENVSAAEVEELLAPMPGVAEVAVVAAPDERLGEHVCAFVRLRRAGAARTSEGGPTCRRPDWPARSGPRSCGSSTNCPGRRRAR